MRILAIHADMIRYRVRKRTPLAEDIDTKEDEMTDCVVLFSCVEKLDEVNPGRVIGCAGKSVRERLSKLKVNRVMIFPYAHLTNTLSSPTTAMEVLVGLESGLREEGIDVKRAPFGWYKEFEIKSKGHPLSDSSVTICPYEGCDCDFQCPYCHNPIKVGDVPSADPGRDDKPPSTTSGSSVRNTI